MRVQSATLALALSSLAACGGVDGDGIHGQLESRGVVVHFETYHSEPTMMERMMGSPGVASRLAVQDHTIYLVAGGDYPNAWGDDTEGSLSEYAGLDWGAMVQQFDSFDFPSKYHEDRDQVRGMLTSLRDVPVGVSGQALQQGLAEGLAPQEDSGVDSAAPEYWADLSSGTGGEEGPRNRGFRDRHYQPGYEFRQRLELYSMHAFRTGYDHSGTITYTYRRRAGTNDPWEEMDRKHTCNHGACPGIKKDMKLYEVCDANVATDWYVIDGECAGHWLTSHLCNDDTAMQVAHAMGIWKGNECPGTKRGIRPHCGRPW